MKLWMLRHAPTVAEPGMCYGITDYDASPELTLEIAQRVAPELPGGVDMYVSPLVRCAQLAAALQPLRPDLTPEFDTRISEMNFGTWEGRLWADIARIEFDAWTHNFATAHAGATGESTQMFLSRVADAYDEWRAVGRDAIWITHAGVMRAVLLLHTGVRHVDKSEDWPTRPIAYGDLITLQTR